MAKEHPMYALTDFGDYEFHEFPMAIYPGSSDGGKTPDPDPRKPGKFLQDAVIVQDEDERRRVLGLDAQEPETPARATTAPKLVSAGGVKRLETEDDQRAALIERADVLGVQIDRRWSLARIEDAIQAHQAASEVV